MFDAHFTRNNLTSATNAEDLDTERTYAPILLTKFAGVAAPKIQSKTTNAKQNANYVEMTTRPRINDAKQGTGSHTSSKDEDGNVPGERNKWNTRTTSTNKEAQVQQAGTDRVPSQEPEADHTPATDQGQGPDPAMATLPSHPRPLATARALSATTPPDPHHR